MGKTTRPWSGFSEQWRLMHGHPSSPAGPGNRNPQSRYSTRSKEVTAQAAEASPWFPAKGGCQGWLSASQVKVQDTVQALEMEGGEGIKHREHAQKVCKCMHLEHEYNVCCHWDEWLWEEGNWANLTQEGAGKSSWYWHYSSAFFAGTTALLHQTLKKDHFWLWERTHHSWGIKDNFAFFTDNVCA